MPRYIMKLHDDSTNKDFYLEWSTIVDAPVTYGMNFENFKEYYQRQYGISGMRDFEVRMKRVEQTGISAHPPFDEIESYFEYNRAGDNESTINKQQIIEKYCTIH